VYPSGERGKAVYSLAMDVFSVLLIVDDDALVRAFLRDELEARGHVVLTARDAVEARTLLEQVEDRVVVVLDLMLPGMNGVELLAELHPRSPAHLRFVLVSASQVVGRVAQDHPLVVGRLEKPIDLARLVEHVQAAESQLALAPG
jgi:DNA-binding NtrC family response regulator